MGILAAIKREEKKVKKQLAKLQHELSGLQVAATAFGAFHRTLRERRLGELLRQRWAKFRAQAKKVAG